MALWRCPHCGTPQPVTARCWVCRRSSTSCGTCRHFRASVAARIGYCGLDRNRQPLACDEIRTCWVPAAPLMAEGEAAHASDPEPDAAPLTGPLRLRGFVHVESVFLEAPDPAPPAVAATPPPAPAPTIIPSASPAADGMLGADLDS